MKKSICICFVLFFGLLISCSKDDTIENNDSDTTGSDTPPAPIDPVSTDDIIHYVTPTGSGALDGTSWENAYPGTSLQDAIDVSETGDEVWVATGVYVTTPTTDRTISFNMKNGIAIYGSFAGTETMLSERNLTNGITSILSGEIGIVGAVDNSYTVIYNEQLDDTAVIDGFEIKGGNDDRQPTSGGNGLGGGIYNHGYGSGGFCSPIIRNCLFTQNTASFGAGAFNNGYNGGHTEPTYINCIFYQNHALNEAGGMDSYGVRGNASPTVINSIFYENTSASNVGAMYAWGGGPGGNCNPQLINCVFVNNRALNGYGGAFIADNLDENGTTSSGSCTVTLQNCIVWGNTATEISPQFYVRGQGAQVLATYSDIDLIGQTSPHIIAGATTGNINANPLFSNIDIGPGSDGIWRTNDDGLKLQSLSPCIDTGNNAGVISTDILLNNRIFNATVDIGAYEFE
ncbi:choice-of-anchor Q domain-containing protein [Aquimarina macrocephali]|uniref:choice-of-anchor Q domain-containing protein n=1 Tax=Aquimarina macrocephali TaxID=666563 RepID=UPI0004BBADF9|nr:choice-of-anchor Q domain-containing protein [Aquimarina macrocephali]